LLGRIGAKTRSTAGRRNEGVVSHRGKSEDR
jgi:hypothetical protein